MKNIDDKIKAWRKEARRCSKSALELYKSLDRENVKPDIAVLIEATMASVYFAAALDAAYFGDMPKVDRAAQGEASKER
jgi:hypothetical protein